MNALKAAAQVAVFVLAAIYAALTDGGIDAQEWLVVIGVGVGSAGVYIVPNLDVGIGRYAKGVVSFLTAGLPVLHVTIVGGLTTAEVVEVVLAGLAAIGFVTVLPNSDYAWARETLTAKKRAAQNSARSGTDDPGSHHNPGGFAPGGV